MYVFYLVKFLLSLEKITLIHTSKRMFDNNLALRLLYELLSWKLLGNKLSRKKPKHATLVKLSPIKVYNYGIMVSHNINTGNYRTIE